MNDDINRIHNFIIKFHMIFFVFYRKQHLHLNSNHIFSAHKKYLMGEKRFFFIRILCVKSINEHEIDYWLKGASLSVNLWMGVSCRGHLGTAGKGQESFKGREDGNACQFSGKDDNNRIKGQLIVKRFRHILRQNLLPYPL